MKPMSHREVYIKKREKHMRSARRTKLILKRWKAEDAKR
jgi:hypothetical protein